MIEAQTLVLSQAYEPIKVVPWQRAIELLTLGKVEVLHEYDHEIRSAYLVLKMPAVVRLIRMFKKQKKALKFSRVNIYARDNWTCQYCGLKYPSTDLTYDHVVPRRLGGKTEWTNIVTCCWRDNARKGGRTPEQAGMKLLKLPVQPKAVPAVYIQLSRKNVPEAWRDYLYWTGSLHQDKED